MALFAVACDAGKAGPGGDAGGAGDGGPPAGDLAGACDPTNCPAPKVCLFNACLDPPPGCTDDSTCENDSYCNMGQCIPYGLGPRGPFDPNCQRLQAIGLLAPKTKCEWTGPAAGDLFPNHHNVLTTPLVVDFDFDNNPQTHHPSIVFMSYNCDDGGCGVDATNGCYGIIRVIDGDTCKDQYSVGAASLLIGSVTPAIGDLDGDGRPDIVAEHIGGGIAGYKYDATSNSFVPLWTNYSSENATGCHWDSLSIHDLDDDGKPEILENGPFPAAYDSTGALIDAVATDVSYSELLHPVAADIDGDGQVEMVDGRETYRFDKTTKKWTLLSTGQPGLGQVAIADFGTFGANPALDDRSKLDGIPEIAVVTSGHVRVQTQSGRVVFGPIALPYTDAAMTAGTGGAPTVADFDGDGRAEIGVAGASAYAVFDPDCVAGASAATCASQTTTGVLWYKASQDQSSNVTGSSVFDFDGDGVAEVVYADECFARVYEGTTGEVLFSQFHTSCTWYENPIVADVDGKFRSQVVIPSNQNCSVSCPAIDPIDNGVRCDVTADCPGTTTCARENAGDRYGRCRCNTSVDCVSSGLTCVDPIAGPSAQGKVCRAQHPVGTSERGILVLHDAQDRWVSSRPIWNQHAYAVTNVNDDGTIPKTSAWKNNWKDPKLNNFRMNVQGALDPKAAPDLTSTGNAPPGMHVTLNCDASGTLHLEAKLCNRGTFPVGGGEPLSFYAGSPPTSTTPICTAMTTMTLMPGQCEVVGCDWVNAPTSPTDVTMMANDDGTGASNVSECDGTNNLGTLLGVVCNPLM
ncbi:MAG TPA: VCBS repeat-containing protein [Polyangia bacterium]|nr:VCBS repeat-containing protein [Polyangia bacterium]